MSGDLGLLVVSGELGLLLMSGELGLLLVLRGRSLRLLLKLVRHPTEALRRMHRRIRLPARLDRDRHPERPSLSKVSLGGLARVGVRREPRARRGSLRLLGRAA
jgi:hypothetical protein